MTSQRNAQPEDCPPTEQATNGAVTSQQAMDGNAKPDVDLDSLKISVSANPYCFPENLLFQAVTYNGVAVRKFPVSVDSITQIQRIRNLFMRPDDILIAAFPKCGTHWVSEMLHMLVNGTTDYSTRTKEFNMLELIQDGASLDHLDSPRVLNSHLYFAHLPEQIVEKKVKLVHLIRNPKDCAVSLYHHIKPGASAQFTFDNFLKGYIQEDYTTRSHQFNYLRQMSQFEQENPDHPVLHIHYEDLKTDPLPTLQKLAVFVNIQVSRKFCQEVISACGHDKMKEADVSRPLPSNLQKVYSKGYNIYRKGLVGDWKNTFSVAQNEMFDQFMATQEEKGQANSFRWH